MTRGPSVKVRSHFHLLSGHKTLFDQFCSLSFRASPRSETESVIPWIGALVAGAVEDSAGRRVAAAKSGGWLEIWGERRGKVLPLGSRILSISLFFLSVLLLPSLPRHPHSPPDNTAGMPDTHSPSDVRCLLGGPKYHFTSRATVTV